MQALPARRTTVAEYLVRQGFPADWRFGSPLGRVAAEIYRHTYRREPSRAWRFINGRFRRVMAYRPTETHILTAAWEQYGRTAGQAPTRTATRPRTSAALVSGDAMRWTPNSGPVRSHP